ncbi:MAG: alpha-amylase family glycosyl hydrolase [Gemmataceae bacterium]
MPHPLNPSLYQINTRICLGELSDRLGKRATLDDFPDAELDRFLDLGFDRIWLLGAWQTGPAGRQVSLTQPEWRQEYRATLHDFRDADVSGSPFAIYDYALHADFGNRDSLPRFREKLGQRGIRLLLDFVPNHVALDHPWVKSHPEYFIEGTETDLARNPQNYCRVEGADRWLILAHGRDPYFPGWPDTLQLNYRHPALRAAMIKELHKVAALGDGVRCDMAMLLLPDVFGKTWGDASIPHDGSAPVDSSFWPEAIDAIRAEYPDFLFMAEVYWDLEGTLQQLGFDYTYDKRLYDRLRARDAAGVRGHLNADLGFQQKSVRFLENHDEPRAASMFDWPIHQAAAIVTFLVPGLRLFHDGQFEGRRIKVSMHLGRRPAEGLDSDIQAFYERLLKCIKRSELNSGHWRLLHCRPAWDGNPTWWFYLAFSWEGDAKTTLVVVNFGPTRGQCRIELPFADLAGKKFTLTDLMGSSIYERDGGELACNGLFIDLPAWGYNVFDFAIADSA